MPGHTAHTVVADPGSKSLFVGDGWGVAHAALRLHRFDPETGEHLAEVRTRHQQVSAMVVAGERLYAATSSRLLELRPEDLSVQGHWEKVLPSDSQQLIFSYGCLVAANWRKPTIGLFEPGEGRSTRLRVGLQPLLVRHGDAVKVIDGFDGGVRLVDVKRRRLSGAEPTPPVASVTAGRELWGVDAGKPESVNGAPAVQLKRGTDRVLRLTGGPWGARLTGQCQGIVCDDTNELIWCVVGPRRSQLAMVSQGDGWVVGSFPAGPARSWVYLDPSTGLAVTSELASSTEGYRATPSVSVLTGHVFVP